MSSSREKTRNLLLFFVACLEALYIAGFAHFQGLFQLVGADFRVFYAAATIARDEGFPFIYDLERHAVVQERICRSARPHSSCAPIPMLFLPVFVLPFVPFTFMQPVLAFAIWSVFNSLGVWLILSPWPRPLPPSERRFRLMLALLAFPTLVNLLWGQIGFWLVLCVGAFLREWQQGSSFRAGLWLSGLLIKPQVLLLIVPALALARQWEILAGAAVGAAALTGASYILVGPSGWAAWTDLMRRLSMVVPDVRLTIVGLEIMMNWRSLGALLSGLLPHGVAWVITTGGTLITAVAALTLAARVDLRRFMGRERFTLGILAATSATAWHAHSHTAMILLPPLLRLDAQQALPHSLLPIWTILPMLAPLGRLILEAFRLIPPAAGLEFLIASKILFGLNLYLTVWMGQRLNREHLSEVPG